MTPPASLENRAQLVPNWNSMGMPVTTPMAKLMAKIFAQKRAAWLYAWLPVRRAAGLQDDDQQRQPHGELRKQVVESDGEREMQAMNRQRRIHGDP